MAPLQVVCYEGLGNSIWVKRAGPDSQRLGGTRPLSECEGELIEKARILKVDQALPFVRGSLDLIVLREFAFV
jgi:hypothetical protein